MILLQERGMETEGNIQEKRALVCSSPLAAVRDRGQLRVIMSVQTFLGFGTWSPKDMFGEGMSRDDSENQKQLEEGKAMRISQTQSNIWAHPNRKFGRHRHWVWHEGLRL